MTIYKTTVFGDEYQMRANFAEASCSIQVDSEDGWETTPYQVADFRHRPESAMRQLLTEYIRMGGDDPESEDMASAIKDAIEGMTETDD